MNLFRYLILGLAFVSQSQGIFEDCDYYQELEIHKSYFVYSPGYPKKYPPGTTCRWYGVSPVNTKIIFTCEEFYIPPSRECHLDRLSVSRGGKIDLSDVENFCGEKKLEILSHSNQLNIVLLTVPHSPGGSFFCLMSVKEDNPKPVPTPNPNCACGYSNPMRIVGGVETGVNEYPMMAGLIDGKKKELFCGATIISKKFSLTAAHCVFRRRPENIGLLVGDHDISVGNETDSARLLITERFYVHPKYDTENVVNDVALVSVKGQIDFHRKVGPACLPFLNIGDTFEGETVNALGWGVTYFTGPNSEKLLKVPLDVVELKKCQMPFGDRVSDHQICTYKEDKDACLGDSGGPLLWRDNHSGVVKIVGIISYGFMCGTPIPSVNTRVTSYLDWIQDTTGEDYCII